MFGLLGLLGKGGGALANLGNKNNTQGGGLFGGKGLIGFIRDKIQNGVQNIQARKEVRAERQGLAQKQSSITPKSTRKDDDSITQLAMQQMLTKNAAKNAMDKPVTPAGIEQSDVQLLS